MRGVVLQFNMLMNTSVGWRIYIGQYLDDATNLDYLNARYYDSGRGQFLSEDPVFWRDQRQQLQDPLTLNSPRTTGSGSNSGNTQATGKSASGWSEYMLDPQGQNSYAYGRGNPIRYKDVSGLWYQEFFGERVRPFGNRQSWSSFQQELGEASNQLAGDNPSWNFAFTHLIETGVVVGVSSGLAASGGVGGAIARGAFTGAARTAIAVINAIGYGQTGQAYVDYRATGSTASRNQAVYDAGIILFL